MTDKNPGIPRPSKDKQAGKTGSLKDQKLLDNYILQCIHYVELSKDAVAYLRKHKRSTQFIELRFNIEANLIINQLVKWLGISPAWIDQTVSSLRANQETWKKEVENFADLVSPEKSMLVTQNLEQELMNLKGRNALLGDQNKGPGVPPGKGKVII